MLRGLAGVASSRHFTPQLIPAQAQAWSKNREKKFVGKQETRFPWAFEHRLGEPPFAAHGQRVKRQPVALQRNRLPSPQHIWTPLPSIAKLMGPSLGTHHGKCI